MWGYLIFFSLLLGELLIRSNETFQLRKQALMSPLT